MTETDPLQPTPQETSQATLNLLKGQVEAVLFLTGKPLSIAEITELTEASYDAVEEAVMTLVQDYAFRDDSAMEIDDTEGYILQVREAYAGIVNRMMPVELSAAVLRTLSAIAIKAPIKQSDLVEFRGSTAYEHIQELLAKKLVSKRRQGRSYVLNVTPHFYEYFKLTDDKKSLERMLKLGLLTQHKHLAKKAQDTNEEAEPDLGEDWEGLGT